MATSEDGRNVQILDSSVRRFLRQQKFYHVRNFLGGGGEDEGKSSRRSSKSARGVEREAKGELSQHPPAPSSGSTSLVQEKTSTDAYAVPHQQPVKRAGEGLRVDSLLGDVVTSVEALPKIHPPVTEENLSPTHPPLTEETFPHPLFTEESPPQPPFIEESPPPTLPPLTAEILADQTRLQLFAFRCLMRGMLPPMAVLQKVTHPLLSLLYGEKKVEIFDEEGEDKGRDVCVVGDEEAAKALDTLRQLLVVDEQVKSGVVSFGGAWSWPDEEKKLRDRMKLLEALNDPRLSSLYSMLICAPETVRKKATLERNLLSLRDFQKELREKVLLESRKIGRPLQDIFLQPEISKGLSAFQEDIFPTHTGNPSSFPLLTSPFTVIEGIRNNWSRFDALDLSFLTSSMKQKDHSERKLGDRMSLAAANAASVVGISAVDYTFSRADLDYAANSITLPEDLEKQRDLRFRMAACARGKALNREWQLRRSMAQKLAQAASAHIVAIEMKKRQIREREQKERMRLLKENDIDKYIEMVKQTKNKRLQELLDSTEAFLMDMGAKVAEQKQETVNLLNDMEGKAEASPRISVSEDTSLCPQNEAVTSREKYYLLSHKIRETVSQPRILVGGLLMPYQLAGLEWMVSLYNNNLHGILADEMGLGKTIQTISLFAYLKETKACNGPHLVIVPLSTMPNWASEFEKWCPVITCIQFRGSKLSRKDLVRKLRGMKFEVCLTTFEIVLREKAALSSVLWKYIVVDEGHRMKNVKSKFHVTLTDFKVTHRLLLTGTPLQNNLTELWSLLNFLLPKIFSSSDDFERWFSEPFQGTGVADTTQTTEILNDEEQMLIINRLHSVLRPFLLRRIKADVLEDLPDKREFVVRIDLSLWQKISYKQIQHRAIRTMDSMGNVAKKGFQNTLMQLRKITNHPYLFVDDYILNENLYRVAGKFEVLDRMLPKLIHFKHKVLVFCQMTQLMDILGDYLLWRNIKYHRLDGAIGLQERKERMDFFNDPEDDAMVFILSTRAGGLGLNLQAADTVILFDSDFNPHQDLQAMCRAHRVGQRNEVRVFRLVTISGVEELILSKAQHKLDIDEKVIQAGMFNMGYTEQDREERLRSLLVGRDVRLSVRATTPQQLNRYMARSEAEEEWYENYDVELFGQEFHAAFCTIEEQRDTEARHPPESACVDFPTMYKEDAERSNREPTASSTEDSGIQDALKTGKATLKDAAGIKEVAVAVSTVEASQNSFEGNELRKLSEVDDGRREADAKHTRTSTSEEKLTEGFRLSRESPQEEESDIDGQSSESMENSKNTKHIEDKRKEPPTLHEEKGDGTRSAITTSPQSSSTPPSLDPPSQSPTELLLINSHRLMNAEEIPSWVVDDPEDDVGTSNNSSVALLDDEDEEVDDQKGGGGGSNPFSRGGVRKLRARRRIFYSDGLSEAKFLNIVERVEAGEETDLQSALLLEMQKREQKKSGGGGGGGGTSACSSSSGSLSDGHHIGNDVKGSKGGSKEGGYSKTGEKGGKIKGGSAENRSSSAAGGGCEVEGGFPGMQDECVGGFINIDDSEGLDDVAAIPIEEVVEIFPDDYGGDVDEDNLAKASVSKGEDFGVCVPLSSSPTESSKKRTSKADEAENSLKPSQPSPRKRLKLSPSFEEATQNYKDIPSSQ